jgi:hypothetical protein
MRIIPSLVQVAVGMPVTRHPRTAPGVRHSRTGLLPRGDVQASTGACRTQPSACDRRPRRCGRLLVSSATFPLARSLPSTCSAGPPGATVVRRLPRSSEAVRLPAPVHHGRTPWVHRADLASARQATGRASRVPHTVCLRMPEVSDPAGSVSALPERRRPCGLPRVRSASAPEKSADFGAPYSACVFPCQRFADAVTDACA